MIGWNKKMGVNIVFKSFDPGISFNDMIIAGEISLEEVSVPEDNQISKMFNDFEELPPYEYLNLIEANVPDKLISTNNYSQIKNIAKFFKNNITSFFGFETNICNNNSKSDYLFAISSRNGEREALLQLLESGIFPSSFINNSEWQNIYRFTKEWANSESILFSKVHGLWLEFDSNEYSNETPIPSVFFHPASITASKLEKIEDKWFTRIALPLLTGKKISSRIEENLFRCVEKLPPGAALFQIGAMLSRSSDSIRLVFKRIQPDDIIPYLQSIGYKKDTTKLKETLNELKEYVTRMVLHIRVGEEIDPVVGIEGSFYPDKYHEETGWAKFLDYLKDKGLCHPEKYSALINYPGIETNENEYDNEADIIPSIKMSDDTKIKTLIRYISHIKITYSPDRELEAKAYSGVRVFSI